MPIEYRIFDRDKFNIVGNPTVTDDGIASGFKSGNYLTLPNTIDLNRPFKITGKFNSGNTTSPQCIIFLSTSIGYLFFGVHSDSYPIMYFPQGTGFAWQRTNSIIQNNTDYFYEFVWNGSQLRYSVGLNKDDLNNTTGNITPTDFTITSSSRYIGINATTSYICNGSIDLKQFSITADGVEIFAGSHIANIVDKLNYLKDSKELVRQFIEAKGVEVPIETPFREYADKIGEIPSGATIVQMTQAEYDELVEKDPNTLYVIVG